jgi:hypothetical protein
VVNGGYPNAVNDQLMQNFKNVLMLKNRRAKTAREHRKRCDRRGLEHDPEKCVAVSRLREALRLDASAGEGRSEKIMLVL